MNRSPQIIKLTPPPISNETVLQEIVCTRPMRKGKFNISLEQKSGKTVIHCYGHGGAGWTTLFGSVNQAMTLFEKNFPNKAAPIRIIGSGCMGLTTAIELSRLGYLVAGISTKSLYDISSWRAGGYFAFLSLKTSPDAQAFLHEIGLNTFMTYRTIESGQHPYISKDAVKFMSVYCSIDTDTGIEDLETRGMIPPRQYVTLDFGNGVIHHDFVKYMTYFINTNTVMRQLTEEVKRLECKIEIKEINSFDEIKEEIIFNCSGLGGRELNSDENMIPVRGHLIVLKDAVENAHKDYMIYTTVKQEGKEEYIYMFPKNVSVTSDNPQGVSCGGVIGGTFIREVDKLSPADQAKLDQIEFKRLLERNSRFFHGKPFGVR